MSLNADSNVALGAVNPVNGPNASTVSIAVTATSQNVALPQAPSAGNYGTQPVPGPNAGSSFIVDNLGAAGFYVYVAFGGSTVAATIPSGATAGSYPCPPGKSVVQVNGNPQYVAIIAGAAGPTTVYVTPANGSQK